MAYEQVDLFTFLLAFAAGVISFLSPCVLPIVPGYLSVVTGFDLAGGDASGVRPPWARVARDTGLFVAGFGVVFVLLGVSATALGGVIFDNQLALTRISGVLVLAMSFFLLGSVFLQAPWLYQEKRLHPDLGRFGAFAPPIAGVAFGFGWTPCIGPVLGSILAVAATQGRAGTGAALLATYALGLGVPFLLAGLAMARLATVFGWVKRHSQGLVIVSALSLAFFGVLLITNQLAWVTGQLQGGLRALGLDWIVELG